jgi:hypothetical protein
MARTADVLTVRGRGPKRGYGNARLAVAALAALAAGSSCEGPPDPPTDGFLLVTVVASSVEGTELENVRALEVTAFRREVIHRSDCADPSTETHLVISDAVVSGSLSLDRPNLPQIVSPQLPVPPGCVTQVRLLVEEMRAIFDGGDTQTIKVPSGAQSGLKINPADGEDPFPIATGRTTILRIDYDATKKSSRTRASA